MKLPLFGVNAVSLLNPCLGVDGTDGPDAATLPALPAGMLLLNPLPPFGPWDWGSGVFLPLPAPLPVAPTGTGAVIFGGDTVALPPRGGGRNPSRTPSRNISSRTCDTVPFFTNSSNFFHNRNAIRASSIESCPSIGVVVVVVVVVAAVVVVVVVVVDAASDVVVVLVAVVVATGTGSSWIYSLNTAQARYLKLNLLFLPGWK